MSSPRVKRHFSPSFRTTARTRYVARSTFALARSHTAPVRPTHGTSDAQPAAQAYKRWFKEIREAYLVRCLSLTRLSLPPLGCNCRLQLLLVTLPPPCPSLPPFTAHCKPVELARLSHCLSLPLSLCRYTSTSNVAFVAVSHCPPLTPLLPIDISCCRSTHCRVATFIHCVVLHGWQAKPTWNPTGSPTMPGQTLLPYTAPLLPLVLLPPTQQLVWAR